MLIDFTPDPALYPLTSRWFDSSQGRVHYVDEGSGPVIMFFHGNPTWSFLYRELITGPRDQFRCIAADYLDHLNLDGYLTMGQGWGGPISLAVDVERADRVRGVVLGNTWFWPAADLPTKGFSKIMGSPPMQWAILQRNFFVEKIIPAATATSLSDAVMEHYRRASHLFPILRSGRLNGAIQR